MYGLGADATRAEAVQGIYAAKQRPADNPLIVHVSCLSQLREVLRPAERAEELGDRPADDPIPAIYYSLIKRFWPGPLTIIVPLPTPSPFAPQVTASLSTVGVRMPASLLALALIHLAQAPLAAPSANTSSKPSPTTAAHVLQDLAGRIDLIIDGGPCDVGIESTVVDGLVYPPLILRPGGVSVEQLRECSGWEEVAIGYKDGAEEKVPKAPGMKYRHYSPNAKVVLVEGTLGLGLVQKYTKRGHGIGILTTKNWGSNDLERKALVNGDNQSRTDEHKLPTSDSTLQNEHQEHTIEPPPQRSPLSNARRSQIALAGDLGTAPTDIWTIDLGPDTASIARGLFSALRELDLRGVGTIYVESIQSEEGDAAAAVMNRLRKAAEITIRS